MQSHDFELIAIRVFEEHGVVIAVLGMKAWAFDGACALLSRGSRGCVDLFARIHRKGEARRPRLVHRVENQPNARTAAVRGLITDEIRLFAQFPVADIRRNGIEQPACRIEIFNVNVNVV